jgi:hypothetical protein
MLRLLFELAARSVCSRRDLLLENLPFVNSSES